MAVTEQKEIKSDLILPKSAIVNPYSWGNSSENLRSRPSFVPASTLRRMAQIPAVAAVINTRLNQVAKYTNRPRFEGDVGFRIGLRDRNRKMTDSEKKRAYEIEEFFLRTGSVKNRVRKDNFNMFVRKIVRDSLVLDTMVWENVFNRKGEIAELWAVDASTIEVVINQSTGDLESPPVYVPETVKGRQSSEDIAYVQKIEGQIVAEYTEEELAYAIRNPRTDLDYVDFGLSELEILIEIITGIINGIRYNGSYFSHSHVPQGVLEIVGNYKDEHLESFRRQWQKLTEGASGKWSIPVMAIQEGQGLKFTSFSPSNKDMEFNQFLEFLFNLTCSVYQIDPNEVGFKSWASSGYSYRSDNTVEKIRHSKNDKGFVPLMNFLSDTFNSEIVFEIDDEFVFEWVGLDEEDEDKKIERIQAKLNAGYMTVAEIRREEDMEEIADENGKPALWTQAPANPQLLQVYMQQLQEKHQKELDSTTPDSPLNNDPNQSVKKSVKVKEDELPDIPVEWSDY